MAGKTSYRATLKAKPGTLLRGGVRSWTSGAWSRQGKVVPVKAARRPATKAKKRKVRSGSKR